MAGGEVNCSIELRALNLVGHGGSRRKRLAKQSSHAVLLQDCDRQLRKLLRVEPRVVRNQNRRVLFLAVHVLGDRGYCQPDIRKRKIVGNQSAPAGSAKLDGRCIQRRRSAHSVVFYPSFSNREPLRKGRTCSSRYTAST